MTPDPSWTVNSNSLVSIVEAVEALGVNAAELLRELAIDPVTLDEPEHRHPAAIFYRLYELAVTHTRLPDIGIHVGRIDYIRRLNLQLYTCSVCETFRDYLNLIPSVIQFAGDLGEVMIRREGDLIRLDWVPLWPESGKTRYPSDAILTTSAAIVNSLCVQPIPVRAAQLTYPEPADISLLKQTLGDNLVFDAPVSALYFDRVSLDFPLIRPDASWSRALGRGIHHLFAAGGHSDGFMRELRNALLRLLPAGGVNIDRTAAILGISRRTLQRRLEERGTQFLQVLQELRGELALQYLADDRLTITDIAFLLGYADHGSFSGAFKTWYGQSPRDYRKR